MEYACWFSHLGLEAKWQISVETPIHKYYHSIILAEKLKKLTFETFFHINKSDTAAGVKFIHYIRRSSEDSNSLHRTFLKKWVIMHIDFIRFEFLLA